MSEGNDAWSDGEGHGGDEDQFSKDKLETSAEATVPKKVPADEPFGSDDEKKKKAMAECLKQHEDLLACIRTASIFKSCWVPQRAFWNCYEKHRGVRGNKMMPSFSVRIDPGPEENVDREPEELRKDDGSG